MVFFPARFVTVAVLALSVLLSPFSTILTTALDSEIIVAIDELIDSGISGDAKLTDNGDGTTTVAVTVEGAIGDHPMHLHAGSCAQFGDVVAALNDVDENGSSVSDVPFSLSTIQDTGPHSIIIHRSVHALGDYVACGDIPTDESSESESAMQQSQAYDAEIVFVVQDLAGNPVGGVCLFGEPIAFTFAVCDNHDGSDLVRHASPDHDPAMGTIRVVDHYSGSDVVVIYTVSSIPEGYVYVPPGMTEFSELRVQPVPDGSTSYLITLAASPGSSGDQSSSAQSGCTLVELYPGYPGYRGYVTGIAGLGEAACVEQLEDDFPLFSKDEEDAANLAAAQSLGISGSMDEWVWESWMAIGAERGLGSICYVCIWTGNDPAPSPAMRVEVSSNDPRLELTAVGSQSFVQSFAVSQGIQWGQSTQWLPTDDELRAVAALLWTENYPTASQLVEASNSWLDQLLREPGIPPYGIFYSGVIERGGYYPGSGGMSLEDQFYLIDHVRAMDYWKRSGALSLFLFQSMQNHVVSSQSNYLGAFAHGSVESYAEYVRLYED